MQTLQIFLDAAVMVAAIVLLTRINGLRSFSKMSAFDFGITVAIGSVLASTLMSPSSGLVPGLTALAALFLVQAVIKRLRVGSDSFQGKIDNTPLLVFEDGKRLDDNLDASGMTRTDLYAKLREANATRLDRVKAVVFESTGDVSVLHVHDDDASLSAELLQGVARQAR